MKDYDEAIKDFEEAIKLDPNDPSKLKDEITKC